MKRWLLLASTLFMLAPAGASADNYQETASWWFLNMASPNWTCADQRNTCFPSVPNAGTFVGAYTVRHNGTLYAYVQGNGTPGPCNPTHGGDNFCVFTTTDTAPGWTGTGLSLVNHYPRPDDAWFWQLRSAFFDPNFNAFKLIASRTVAGDFNGIDEMDAELGTSADGVNFTWTVLLKSFRTQIGVRLEDYVLVPHPTLSKVWVGTITWFDSQGRRRIAPWKVDWNTNTVYVANSAGQLQAIPVGGTLTFAPQAAALGRVTNITPATGAAGGRLEAWGTASGGTSGSGVQNNPCPPGFPNGVATSRYLTNRTDPQQVGSTVVNYRIFDPNTLTFTTNWIAITSLVRGLPSDYAFAESWMADRFAAGGRDYVYTGSKDNVICNSVLVSWNPWAGSGILVTKVTYQP